MLFRYLRSNFLFWFGGIFTAVGLIVLAGAIFVAIKTARRKQGYYQSTATVTDRHGGANGNDDYVHFRYADRNGGLHETSVNISKRKYAQWQPGRQFQVNVSLVNPRDAWLVDEGAPTYWIAAALVFLGSCFFIPGVTFAVKQLRRILRGVAAIARGQYVIGRVEEILSTNEHVNGRSLYRVAWSWQGPDGKRRRAQSPALSRSDATHWKPGDEIAAYTHPSDPEFAEADVYGFRSR
jgi:Protein of unknown function (DUF3592)